MSSTPTIEAAIERLMGAGHGQAARGALARMGALPEGEFSEEDFGSLVSWTTAGNNATGPFGGIGGAAVTDYRFTILFSAGAMILFAGDKLHGVAAFDYDVLVSRDIDKFEPVSGPFDAGVL